MSFALNRSSLQSSLPVQILLTLYTTISLKNLLASTSQSVLLSSHLSHSLESFPPPFWIYSNVHMHYNSRTHRIPRPFCLISMPRSNILASYHWFQPLTCSFVAHILSAMSSPHSLTLPLVAKGSRTHGPYYWSHTLLSTNVCFMCLPYTSTYDMDSEKKQKVSMIWLWLL